MRYPLSEKQLWKQGYTTVAGLDEAGRGPLAGPVVACALTIDKKYFSKIKKYKYTDSKLLTSKQREKSFEVMENFDGIEWGIGIVSEKEIDKINILQATKRAMLSALAELEKTLGKAPDYAILDGNFPIQSPIPQTSVVQGDRLVYSCSLASIIAKVTRDKMMSDYHSLYPKYGFDKHKGYGTPEHIKALSQFGPCPLHRQTFAPVQRALFAARALA